MTLTHDDIERIRRLAMEATPGPWRWKKIRGKDRFVGKGNYEILIGNRFSNEKEGYISCSNADGDFLESLDPNTILALLALAERGLKETS